MVNRCFMLLLLLSAGAVLPAVATGDEAPEITIQQGWNDAEGNTQFAQYAGRVVLVETWATW